MKQHKAYRWFSGLLLLFTMLLSGERAGAQVNASLGAGASAIQLYEPLSQDSAHGLGELELSDHYAIFSALDGRLELRTDGAISQALTTELGARARAFRILNPDAYFERNRGKNGFCMAPIDWLIIETHDTYTRVLLFQGSDLFVYKNRSGICSEASYVLANANFAPK